MISIDILVVGSGISGLSAAISAKQNGSNVLVATKNIPTKCNSVMAQGGINAALGNLEKDSIELHIEDTLKSAHKLANKEMVELLCSNAPDTIEFLEKIGVPFSRLDNASSPLKSVAQRKLGGASSKRACYAQDYTGLKVLHTLLDYTLNLGIEIKDNIFLLELIKNSKNEVCGALFFNFNSGEVEAIYASKVIIATGGFGSIYSKNTNSLGSSGDGIVTVLKAGGVARGLEFIQFHPTTLKGSNILVSESARGEGGYLVDSKNERFVDELAPRDVVAKAIFDKINNREKVFLDLRNIKDITTLMPQELKLIKTYAKVDATKELVEIEPAVHYSIGGIAVDKNFNAINLKGCFAVGECSNALVHGANRLGGNSLLEAVAFGRLAGKKASDYPDSTIEREDIKYNLPLDTNYSNFDIYKAKEILADTLFSGVGIVREKNSLTDAKSRIEKLNIEKLKANGTAKYNTNLTALLELQNANILAQAIIYAANKREESRGSNIREEFPDTKEEFEYPIDVTLGDIK